MSVTWYVIKSKQAKKQVEKGGSVMLQGEKFMDVLEQPKMGRPSKKPPAQVIMYMADELDLQTSQLAKVFGVAPSTIRVWRSQMRKGKY